MKKVLYAVAAVLLYIIIQIGMRHYFPRTSDLPTPSPTPTPAAPAFTPDADILRHAEQLEAQRLGPWIRPELVDRAKPEVPGDLYLVSHAEPVITREGDAWKITFKTP